MNTTTFPRQGSVYLSKALKQGGDTKKRPVLVVPFSSDITASSGHPGRVVVNVPEGGLERPSVALCDLITTVEKHYLEPQP